MTRWLMCLLIVAQAAGAQALRDFAYGVPISMRATSLFTESSCLQRCSKVPLGRMRGT